MTFSFATCERQKALNYLRVIYPSREIEDTPECAKPLLDWVEADIVRIQDPEMHGLSPQLIPGSKWDEAKREEICAIAKKFHLGN